MKRILTILILLISVNAIGQITSAKYQNTFTKTPSIDASIYKLNGVTKQFSQWVTNGSDIYYTAGNVGIGTSETSRALNVGGSSYFKMGNDDIFSIYDNQNSYLINFIEVANLLYSIDPSNIGYNVGIGTSSPAYKLDVVGTARISGYLIVEMPHVSVFRNTDLTISATQNVWYKMTGFTTKDAGLITVSGDSIQLTKAGHYLINYSASFSGLNNEIWEIGVFKNGALEDPSQLRYTSSSDVGNANCPVYVSSDGDDWISFKIRNTTDNDDPTIKRFSGIISTIHLE